MFPLVAPPGRVTETPGASPARDAASPAQFVEQSICQYPALSVGMAVITGVLVGCFIKRL